MALRSVLAVWLLLSLPAGDARARADAEAADTTLDLAVRAPDGCADSAALKAEVLRLARLGPVAATEARRQPGRRLVATVAIEAGADGASTLTLATELDGVAGRRVISGASCRALADAAALTLALALNPEAAPATEPSTELSTEPATVTRGPPPPPLPAVAARPAAPMAATRLLAGAYLGLEAGVLKSPGPDVALGVGVTRGRASAWLLGSYGPPQDAAVDGQPVGVGGRLWVAGAGALGCWSLRDSAVRVAVAPCLGGEVTRLAGRGTGVSHPLNGAIWWASASAGLTVALRVSRAVSLRLSGLALVPLARPEVFLDDAGLVHRPAAIGGHVRLGVDLAFR